MEAELTIKKIYQTGSVAKFKKNISLQPLQDDAKSFLHKMLRLCVGQLGYTLYNETRMP